ncbi:UNVERIFIED_CONTAM: nicotinamidase/pyrazinamidase [Williamsia faeni]
MSEHIRTALLIVDVQNDFCEGGSLAVSGGSDVAAAITLYTQRDHGYRAVAATRDHHIDPGDHFSDNPDYVDSWPRHCVEGTPGMDFHPRFDASIADATFSKGKYSAAYSGFEGADSNDVMLGDWLRDREINAVDVVGLATDHCVRATALDAVAAGFTTRVLLGYCAGVGIDTTDAAVAEMSNAGVTIVPPSLGDHVR